MIKPSRARGFAVPFTCLLIAALMTLVGCSSCSESDTESTTKPPDCNLTLWINETVSDGQFNDFVSLPVGENEWSLIERRYDLIPDGLDSVPDGKEFTAYTVTEDENKEDGEKRVTAILVRDSSVSLFGLTVNSSAEDFVKTFSEHGYDVPDPEDVDVTPSGNFKVSATYPDGSFSVTLSNFYGSRELLISSETAD